MTTINLDLSDVHYEEAGSGAGWTALPTGEYKVMITKAEAKDTQRGGIRIGLDLTVVDGDANGQTVREGLNIVCPGSPTAEEISRKLLKNLADASGLAPDFLMSSGTEALMGKMVVAEVLRKKGKDERYTDDDGFENSVRAFNRPSVQQPASPVAAASAADDQPW